MSAATITAPSPVARLAPATGLSASGRARAAVRASAARARDASDARAFVAIDESTSVSRRASLAAAAAATGLALVAAPPRARASAAASLEQVVELTPENFAAEVEGAGAGRVFVEFYAPWCPFCQKLEPVWNGLPAKLREANVDTKIARMNVDTFVEYGAAYGVTGFPTLDAVRGREAHRPENRAHRRKSGAALRGREARRRRKFGPRAENEPGAERRAGGRRDG
jgi:thiol-disulfide isomerase/thioredoxin